MDNIALQAIELVVWLMVMSFTHPIWSPVIATALLITMALIVLRSI